MYTYARQYEKSSLNSLKIQYIYIYTLVQYVNNIYPYTAIILVYARDSHMHLSGGFVTCRRPRRTIEPAL